MAPLFSLHDAAAIVWPLSGPRRTVFTVVATVVAVLLVVGVSLMRNGPVGTALVCEPCLCAEDSGLVHPPLKSSQPDGGRARPLIECYQRKECQPAQQYDTPGWLTSNQKCLLNCLGRVAESTVIEQGVFAGLSTLYIADGLRAAARGVQLLSHDIFPTTSCIDQPYCWSCNDETCRLFMLGESPLWYNMSRSQFDRERRGQLIAKYGSFEKYVLAKLYQYDLLDHVFVISSHQLVPGTFHYVWLDTSHSCAEIARNAPGILRRAAPDAVLLFHDIGGNEIRSCLLKTFGRDKVLLSVDGLAVI